MVYKLPPELVIEEIRETGIDPASLPIFQKKSSFLSIKVTDVLSPAASIIKQEMLSAGGDAAVHRNVINCKVEKSNVILMGTEAQIEKAAKKLLQMDYWGLRETGREILKILKPVSWKIQIRGREYNFSENTYLMGIINVTPDSFFEGSRVNPQRAGEIAERMVEDGADFLDIGGESSRPGAAPVSEEEELQRVIPAIREIRKRVDVPISIDTYKARVAAEAIKEGADIINDISALRFDPKMAEVAAEAGVPVILMHMKGTPRDMQKNPYYDDAVLEIAEFLKERAEFAQKFGIRDIILDPGIGFGKRVEDNIKIINSIPSFLSLGYPLLMGHSRKSFMGATTGAPVEHRIYTTVALTLYFALRGVSIIRIHDVYENKLALKLAEAMQWSTL